LQVEILLVVRTDRAPGLLSDKRENRLVVELGIVEAIEKVDCTGSRGCDAEADAARELRVGAGHEPGHLLVTHLDEIERILHPRKRADKAADTVPRITVDPFCAPTFKSLPNEISYGFGHLKLPRCFVNTKDWKLFRVASSSFRWHVTSGLACIERPSAAAPKTLSAHHPLGTWRRTDFLTALAPTIPAAELQGPNLISIDRHRILTTVR
jgi:hypothetical protein